MGLEGYYWKGKSIDGDWIKKNEAKEGLYGDEEDSYDCLMDDDDSTFEELWNSYNLGKYTIDTPSQEKETAEQQDLNMMPVSELEFQKISDDVDLEDAEIQKRLDEMIKELNSLL